MTIRMTTHSARRSFRGRCSVRRAGGVSPLSGEVSDRRGRQGADAPRSPGPFMPNQRASCHLPRPFFACRGRAVYLLLDSVVVTRYLT
jgi:hypothetical protein